MLLLSPAAVRALVESQRFDKPPLRCKNLHTFWRAAVGLQSKLSNVSTYVGMQLTVPVAKLPLIDHIQGKFGQSSL